MFSSLIARVRSLVNGIRNDPDADMQAEFQHHMELRARDLVRSGLSPDDARRQARIEFGGTYNYEQAGREARGLRWFDAMRVSWLDIKLGARMIYRYPGLTLVAGVAMGVAIALGAGVMGVIALMRDPAIPLDEGERIVGIQVWSVASFNAERRIAFDLATWKAELETVRDLGAFRNAVRAVGANDGRAEPGRGAEMNASGFRIARVRPLLGRYLLDDDERPGAPLVVVLGHEIWSGRFGSDSTIVGKTVKIGGVPHIVVGVMPEGFAFPINYNMWLPLRLDPHIEPRQGPVIYAFGTPRARCDARTGTRGSGGNRGAHREAASKDTRAAASAPAAVCSVVVRARQPGNGARSARRSDRGHAATRDHLREHRHPRVRTDGDAPAGDRSSKRAWRESRPHRRAARG